MEKGKFSGFLGKHKWKLIAAAIIVAVIVIMIVRSSGRTKYDVYTIYVGPEYFDSELRASLVDAVEKTVPRDLFDDGKINVSTSSVLYLTSAVMDYYDENDLYYNRETNQDALSDFYRSVQLGVQSLLLMDKDVYDELKKNQSAVLTPLADIFGSVPENAADGYAFFVKDTSLGKTMADHGKTFPENTVICMRTYPFVVPLGEKADRLKRYEYETELFRKFAADALPGTEIK